MKTDLMSMTPQMLASFCDGLALPKFRTAQIYAWMHKFGVHDFSAMSNLPKALRSQLEESCFIPYCQIEDKYVSRLDGTVKYLFRLYDGEYVETVVMHYKYGYTICVSSQVGCKMGCKFCASTLAGYKRNLLPGEIEGQIHAAQNDLGVRISHIVMMGIGEPLDNYENVLTFLENVHDPNGLGISHRNITISTCGLVDKILDLASRKLQITLTVSLHAADNETRNTIMPVNRKWPIEQVLDACRKYYRTTSRRVSFEYTLICGVNDSPAYAGKLAKLLQNMHAHVNLIPVNYVKENKFGQIHEETVKMFCQILQKHNINATIRRTLGADINASCGQLRRMKNRGEQL